MALLVPGVPTAMFARLDAQFELRGRIALTPVADAVKKQAKINASNGTHAYGTKTPARPGTGPAKISGTLYKTIDRSPVTREAFGWFCQVGMVPGQSPWYSRKTSSKYAYTLEVTGCRNGNKYPFLYPAFWFVVNTVAPMIYTATYGAHWARVI